MPAHRYISRFARFLSALLTAVIFIISLTTTVHAAGALDDVELLARLVWLEARGESDEGQQAVVAVVMNRLADGHWGNTLEKVVYASGQFSPARAIPRTTPTEREYANVRAVLESSTPLLPEWVMYFRAGRDHKWGGYEHWKVIGDHWFGGFRKDRMAAERAAEAKLLADTLNPDGDMVGVIFRLKVNDK